MYVHLEKESSPFKQNGTDCLRTGLQACMQHTTVSQDVMNSEAIPLKAVFDLW